MKPELFGRIEEPKMRKFLSKDQNWQDGTTIYWFQIEGEVFGVVEGGSEGTSTIVDSEGMPLEGGGYREIAVRKALDGAVTDELRAE